MRKLVVFLIFAAACAGGWYWWQSGGLVHPVKTVAVKRGTASEVVYATGVVEPERWAKVVAL